MEPTEHNAAPLRDSGDVPSVHDVLRRQAELEQQVRSQAELQARYRDTTAYWDRKIAAHQQARKTLESYLCRLADNITDHVIASEMREWQALHAANTDLAERCDERFWKYITLRQYVDAHTMLSHIERDFHFSCTNTRWAEGRCRLEPALTFVKNSLDRAQDDLLRQGYTTARTGMAYGMVNGLMKWTRDKRLGLDVCPMKTDGRADNCIRRQGMTTLLKQYLAQEKGISSIESLKQQEKESEAAYAEMKRTLDLYKKGPTEFARAMDDDLAHNLHRYRHIGYLKYRPTEWNILFAIAADALHLAATRPAAIESYGDSLRALTALPLRNVANAKTEQEAGRHITQQLWRRGPYMSLQRQCRDEYKQQLKADLDFNEQAVRQYIEQEKSRLSTAAADSARQQKAAEDELRRIERELLPQAIAEEGRDDPARWLPAVSSADAQATAALIARRAEQRYCLPQVSDTPWQDADRQSSNNLYITGRDTTATLNRLLMKMLLAFPVGKLHVWVWDPDLSGFYSQMLGRLDTRLSTNVISTAATNQMLDELEQQVAALAQTTSNLLAYNQQERRLTVAYQVVVLVADGTRLATDRANGERWTRLLQVGYRYGIHFVSATAVVATEHPLKAWFEPYSETAGGAGIPTFYLDYLNRAMRSNDTPSLTQPSWQSGTAFEATPEAIDREIAIPFGDYGNRQEAECIFGDANPQAILIGQTGSGKSYFMHALLLNAMLRYDARSLEIYIMDFKLGAPEFSGYGDFPHVSHLLADGSDRRVVYEVLAGLYARMKERNKLIGASGCRNIADYNRQRPPGAEPMRRILLVVDECQNLFESDSAERRLQEQITTIVERIAAEGRSQGVHFLLGTQTLANTMIPQNVINNISNRFLMQCSDTDADKLVDKGSLKTRQLSQGQVYHSAADKVARIYDYAPLATRAKAAIISRSTAPEGATRFVFSGKLAPRLTTDSTAAATSRHLTANIGKGISVSQADTVVRLKHDMGQNLLIVGNNEQMQGERVLYAALQSMVYDSRQKQRPISITLIDNFDEDDDLSGRREPVISLLEQQYGVSVVSGRRRKQAILRLADEARNGGAGQTQILAILGNERMRRLMAERSDDYGADLPPTADDGQSGRGRRRFMGGETAGSSRFAETVGSSPFQAIRRSGGSGTGDAPAPAARRAPTVEGELRYLLENGPEAGIYTLMQVGRPSAIFTNAQVGRQEILQLFCHIVMLQMPDRDAVKYLPIDADLTLERLPAENERLRAYYYNDERGTAALFTPYVLPSK